MRKMVTLASVFLCTMALCALPTRADDVTKLVKKAVNASTLDQSGTRPFHLKAEYAPTQERDSGSHRTGEVEIWWKSPSQWRREVRSPEFHQIEIVDGAHRWQKNEGDYFPEWLRELAVAIVRPVPLTTDTMLSRVKTAEFRHLMGQTNIDWDPTTSFGDEQSNGKGYIAINDKTGLLFYTGGPGWSGQYRDFKDFHGRMVAYTVASGGYPEVTAKVSVLEDLGDTPNGFFDSSASGGDTQPIETVVLNEAELRKSLLPGVDPTWPEVQNGPLEGVAWTEVVLDRAGRIREMIPPISDNSSLRDAAERNFRQMQFQPVVRESGPVQAMGRLTFHFKTARPAGMENFGSARSYFDLGRRSSCLGAGANAPYFLRAEFQTSSAQGTIATGRYEDTWFSTTEWKREAWFGSSHLIRSQVGEKHYVLSEGPEAGLLRLVMMFVEPIPADDTMAEIDWRISRDVVDGVKTIRVIRGPENPNGDIKPGESNAYWFGESGQLVRSYTSGLDIRPTDVQPYGGVALARRIDVTKEGKLALKMSIMEIGPADPAALKTFNLKGHEWQRALTAEER